MSNPTKWTHPKWCSSEKKPLEIYMFIDPLCPECWGLEPILKKLQIEYGKCFTIKYVISGKLASLNVGTKKKHQTLAQQYEKTASRSGMSCDGSLWFEDPIHSPFLASIGIKAAELQGRRAGILFLRKLQEVLFLEKKNISQFEVLKECAYRVNLDMDEFLNDLHSEGASKAFQCDLKITSEMEVDEIPTLVFFNENIEDEGIKVTGIYHYEVYVQILEEMLSEKLVPQALPPLESFLKYYQLVATKEIAVVYNMEENEVEKQMKRLMLQQKVERIPAKHGTFWRDRS
ncbi:putative DsbA family dithiol-disulfide isomerase [Bacillus pakistanensis]|uniref:ClpXP adapter protein SpxH n=1 Tax=Rossellomorea pakistanensis TaxID=992288 RepID=A0ABS2NFB6_9BACI|nr:ClpXP adapter SpxH family protein [Bacillus pakistanensis]MBM7586533.1 putative DsbA family dithiol-disulfide isomerase [Bacillus pakistanensis]